MKVTGRNSLSPYFFTHWVGRLYVGRGSILLKRVMVLGASHYCGNKCPDCGDPTAHPDCAVFTKDVVRDYLADNYSDTWMATFTTFINSAYGRSTTSDERKRFMDSVVFANFLQRSEGRDANEKHNEYFQLPANLEARAQSDNPRTSPRCRRDLGRSCLERHSVGSRLRQSREGCGQRLPLSFQRMLLSPRRPAPPGNRLSRRGVAPDSRFCRRGGLIWPSGTAKLQAATSIDVSVAEFLLLSFSHHMEILSGTAGLCEPRRHRGREWRGR